MLCTHAYKHIHGIYKEKTRKKTRQKKKEKNNTKERKRKKKKETIYMYMYIYYGKFTSMDNACGVVRYVGLSLPFDFDPNMNS